MHIAKNEENADFFLVLNQHDKLLQNAEDGIVLIRSGVRYIQNIKNEQF